MYLRARDGRQAVRIEARVRLPVLLYHHIGLNNAGIYPSLTVSPSSFEKQVNWLAQKGYVGIRPSDWLQWRREGTVVPEKLVLLTFDDGYADLADHAFPALKACGFGAAVFVVTARIGGINTWDEAQGSGPPRLLTIEQIRYWAAQGIEFGSHSRTHADLTTLTAAQLEEEVIGSQAELSDILGTQAVSFAYPYGSYDDTVRQCARNAYELAFTVEEGVNDFRTDPHGLKRTMCWPGDTVVDLASKVRWGWSPLRSLRAKIPFRSFFRDPLRRR